MEIASREHPHGPRYYRTQGGFSGHRTDLIVSGKGACPAPQVMLIEQDPNTVIRPHYHDTYQYQVFVDGSGSMGKHGLEHFTVHYTSPESAYGPINAGAEGLAYLTLRAVGTPRGAFYIPESRGLMRKGLQRRQVTSSAPGISNTAKLARRADVEIDTLITPEADGVAAWLVRVPPNGRATAPTHMEAGGRFYVVAAGTLLLQDQRHDVLATVWIDPVDEPFDIHAGPQGLEMLVLQFPREATLRAVHTD